MAFKFAARTLLELGKELISSDEVALYELIKNSIDAKSSTVEIEFNICLLKSDYETALQSLAREQNFGSVRNFVISQLQPGAKTVELDKFKSDIELTTDTKTFKSALTQAYNTYNWIEVRDLGRGMSVLDLDQIYLVVGTRSKRKENLEGAQYLGDKGVGRLSAMRLGDKLKVITTTKDDSNLNILEIDWSRFGHDIEEEVGDIVIDPIEGPPKLDTNYHGTIVHISALNADWGEQRLTDMLGGAIARMVDPFQAGRGAKMLQVSHNSKRLLVPSVPSLLLRSAHAKCLATLKFDEEGEPVFSGTIDYSYKNTKINFDQKGVELYSLSQHSIKRRGKKGAAAFETVPISPEAIKSLGEFEVEVYWFNRQLVEKINDLTGKASETKALIANWAGGIMLYRNGFRVLPYGEAHDDWLELDKKAFGGSGFLLNRQQVLGKVTVHSGHTALSEQTNREGLIKSDASDALKRIMMWLMHIEFRSFIKQVNQRDKEIELEQEFASIENIRFKQEQLEKYLNDLNSYIPPTAYDVFNRVRTTVQEVIIGCNEAIELAKAKEENVVNEREQFVYLAGVGLMTEFIFHELDRAIHHTTASLVTSRMLHPDDSALSTLEQQLITLQKRVSAFDEITGEKRQTKTKFDVAEIVKTIMSSHKKQFERHEICCIFEESSLEIRAVKGMLIQIIENLLANSTYWLKQQTKLRDDFDPTIIISLNPINQTLEISDNGPGVSPDRKERIFEAFVTSKPAGQGRGLGLYICREMAVYHDWTLKMGDNIGEYRNGRLNTFILDFKGA